MRNREGGDDLEQMPERSAQEEQADITRAMFDLIILDSLGLAVVGAK